MVTGKKYDAGKVPALRGCLAYFSKALLAVAEISLFGANKYDNLTYEPNWSKVDNGLGRYGDALVRHILKEQTEGLYDYESELLHAAHAAWNALARLEFLLGENPVKKPTLIEELNKILAEPVKQPADPTPSTPHMSVCECLQYNPVQATTRFPLPLPDDAVVERRIADRRVGPDYKEAERFGYRRRPTQNRRKTV